MRKVTIVLLTVILVAFQFLSIPVLANNDIILQDQSNLNDIEIESASVKGTISNDIVNVYSLPSSDSSIIGSLSTGKDIEIYRVINNDSWYAIYIGETVGYINSNDVTINNELLNTENDNSEVDKENDKALIKVTRDVSVFDDINNNKVYFNFNSELEIAVQLVDSNWAILYIAGNKAFVNLENVNIMDYIYNEDSNINENELGENESLSFDEANNSLKSEKTEKDNLQNEENESGNQSTNSINQSQDTNSQMSTFSLNSEKSVLEQNNESLEFNDSIKFFEVSMESSNVYIKVNGELKKIGQLLKGEVYPRINEVGNWHVITFNQKEAYVYKPNTVPVQNASFPSLDKTPIAKVITKVQAPIYDYSSGSQVKYATIEPNLELYVLEEVGNWWKVNLYGRIGYIYKGNVIYKTTLNSNSNYFKITSETHNVYIKWNDSLLKVAELPQGQVYKKVSQFGNWYSVDLGGVMGYVYKDGTTPVFENVMPNPDINDIVSDKKFITLKSTPIYYKSSSGKLISFGVLLPNIEYRLIGESGNWWIVSFLDRIGYVDKGNVKYSYKPSDKYFRVLTDNLNVYVKSSNGLIKEGELIKGQSYKIYENFGNWLSILFGEKVGYVWSPSTAAVSPSSISNLNISLESSPNIITTLNKTPIYGYDGKEFIKFAYLESGVTLNIVKKLGNWIEVLFGNRIGYIYITSTNLKEIINRQYNISFEDALKLQINANPQIAAELINGYVIGNAFSKIENGYGYVQGDNWNIRSGPGTQYDKLNLSNETGYLINNEKVRVLGKELVYNPLTYSYETWYEIDYKETWRLNSEGDYITHNRSSLYYFVDSPPDQVAYYLNPKTFINHEIQKFQFLDLAYTSGISEDELNKVLIGEGILENKGSAFKQAALNVGLNEIYLISHAILETGHGSSALANGISKWVERDEFGNIVKDKNGDPIIIDISPKKVYNMYGIGAFDNCAYDCGAQAAYNYGWFTPEDAIIGGAKFIGNNYVLNGQNTLYKMRWNPDSPGTHQYATDVRWAYNQTFTMFSLYNKMDHYSLRLEIPIYK